MGEKITLRLCSTEEETAELLSKVLNGNKVASEALARVVHQDVAFTDPTLDSTEINVPQDILGIWVDPIDSTYQYIKGSADIKSNQGIFPCGLQCVTILIGVYDIQTGVPLMGVINQPLCHETQTPSGGKDSAIGAFLTWGRTCIHFSSPSLEGAAVKYTLETQAPRQHSPPVFQPSLVQVKRRLSKLHCHVYVEIAYSGQLGLVIRAFVLSKASLTFTSFQKIPRSSGTLVLLMPYCGPWVGE